MIFSNLRLYFASSSLKSKDINSPQKYNKTSSGTNLYPPQYSSCPDYWSINDDGTCKIPESNQKNYGDLYGSSGIDSSKIPYGYKSNGSIDFSDKHWLKNGTSICNQQIWAKTHNIVWDGVSNYNGCT